jgi:putative Holliday junction resolvase
MGILAIDPGVKKSGFAFSDRLRISMRPLEYLRTEGVEERLLKHIAELRAELDISTLLVGMPYHMNGEEGERAKDVRRLIEVLRARFPDLAVHAYDERLTTKEAESRLREAGYRVKEIMQRKDSMSALVLLEDWIESGEPQ